MVSVWYYTDFSDSSGIKVHNRCIGFASYADTVPCNRQINHEPNAMRYGDINITSRKDFAVDKSKSDGGIYTADYQPRLVGI